MKFKKIFNSPELLLAILFLTPLILMLIVFVLMEISTSEPDLVKVEYVNSITVNPNSLTVTTDTTTVDIEAALHTRRKFKDAGYVHEIFSFQADLADYYPGTDFRMGLIETETDFVEDADYLFTYDDGSSELYYCPKTATNILVKLLDYNDADHKPAVVN